VNTGKLWGGEEHKTQGKIPQRGKQIKIYQCKRGECGGGVKLGPNEKLGTSGYPWAVLGKASFQVPTSSGGGRFGGWEKGVRGAQADLNGKLQPNKRRRLSWVAMTCAKKWGGETKGTKETGCTTCENC